MTPDQIRQEIRSWVKGQRDALPERREEWAHGIVQTLRDLEREVDRIFGAENCDKRDLLDALRDQLARVLHDWDHGKTETESPTEPCWHNYRVEADLLMPSIRPHLITAWEDGARNGSRGLLPERKRLLRNPYREHGNACTCEWCYVAAMGGGR